MRPSVRRGPEGENGCVEHYEWQSDAPTPEETPAPWRAPDWVVYCVLAAVVIYLIVGLIVAIHDLGTSTQASGVMVPLTFLFEIVAWPLKWLLPLLQA